MRHEFLFSVTMTDVVANLVHTISSETVVWFLLVVACCQSAIGLPSQTTHKTTLLRIIHPVASAQTLGISSGLACELQSQKWNSFALRSAISGDDL